MTREEAIGYLFGLYVVEHQGDDYEKGLNEALDMAIDALKAEPSTEGRYEKAIKTLQEMPKYFNGIKAKQINKISSEAAQGEWIKKPHRKYLPMDCPWPDGEDYDEETHSCTVYHWHCSCCDYDMHESMKPWYNYCPNCGTKMKGGAV